MHGGGLDRELLLGGAQLIAQGAELDLEPIDRVALFAELRELAGVLGLELVDAHFKPARRHRKLGPQLILIGQGFPSTGGRGFEPPRGQPHRPAMDEGHDDEHAQGREEKSDPENT